MVVPDGEAAGDVLADSAEVPSHALAQRLKGFKAGAAPSGMNDDAPGVVVIDGNKDHGLAFGGPRGWPTRLDASRSFSRMSRSTRRGDARMPPIRSRAQPFR